jgi:FK506-binding nuclear protein
MKVGGTRRLLIPAAQAYGAQSQQGIPANSDLVFDIQLISIK